MSHLDKQPHIIIVAGGTGGHVFPAQALANELKDRVRITVARDRRGGHFGGALDQLPTVQIMAASLSGKKPFGLLLSLIILAIGFIESIFLILRLRPKLVVGFGGYPSVPVMLAAQLLKIPTILHEQNAILGRANQLLAGKALKLAVSFPHTERIGNDQLHKIIHCGNPVRPSFINLGSCKYEAPKFDEDIKLLITGGSQGAAIFAQLIPDALQILPSIISQRIQITQQCRKGQEEALIAKYNKISVRAEIASFLDYMPNRIKDAHLVIARSGASTVSELSAIGRPAILIPYPYAVDDHQKLNAERFSDKGCGWIMPEDELSAQTLAQRLEELFTNPIVLEAAARQAQAFGVLDATERLAAIVNDIIQKPSKS